MKKGVFITLEGSDGSGKSVQAGLLIKNLKKLGFNVVHTREPGGTAVAEVLRKILLAPKNKIFPLTELLLYEASRAQHTEEIIRPALNSGKIIICERYSDASVAYQGFGRNMDKNIIFRLNEIATSGLNPDLTIFFDMDIKKGLGRARRRGKDRLENEDFEFHKRVRKGYLWLNKKFSKRIKVIKANDTIENIAKKIFDIVLIKITRIRAN
ncbi:MAG: dTMP kinase [Elusimicrobia bacterium]|nr:dTMP kinase [Elusimicrobiota bacterium]